ncbi:MAG: hypothetical protein R3222_10345, partial [Balneolaceae bacterium]|nr:hypothetical protein [Balneolaceae bacterium]
HWLGFQIEMELISDRVGYLLIAVSMACLYGGDFIFRTYIRKTKPDHILEKRLRFYRQGLIFRAGLSEMSAVILLVLYLLTGQTLYLMVSIFPIVYLYLVAPDKESLAEHLHLTFEEKEQVGIDPGV